MEVMECKEKRRARETKSEKKTHRIPICVSVIASLLNNLRTRQHLFIGHLSEIQGDHDRKGSRAPFRYINPLLLFNRGPFRIAFYSRSCWVSSLNGLSLARLLKTISFLKRMSIFLIIRTTYRFLRRFSFVESHMFHKRGRQGCDTLL